VEAGATAVGGAWLRVPGALHDLGPSFGGEPSQARSTPAGSAGARLAGDGQVTVGVAARSCHRHRPTPPVLPGLMIDPGAVEGTAPPTSSP